MPKLVHTRDGIFIGELGLKQGELLIGRHPDCDITLDDTTVSGRHALLSVAPSKFMEGLLDVHLEDLSSTNGTTVGGKVIRRHMMKHNEVAKIGEHEFTLIDEQTRGMETTTVILPDN